MILDDVECLERVRWGAGKGKWGKLEMGRVSEEMLTQYLNNPPQCFFWNFRGRSFITSS